MVLQIVSILGALPEPSFQAINCLRMFTDILKRDLLSEVSHIVVCLLDPLQLSCILLLSVFVLNGLVSGY